MTITQSNFQSINAPRFQKLSQDQLERIHFASLEILERTGVRLHLPEAVELLKEAGADIIGANCGIGFDQMVEIAKEIREADASTPVLVQANAGIPIVKNNKTIFPETPEMMRPKIKELIKAGANIIGGCCGTTPEHIRVIVKEIRG